MDTSTSTTDHPRPASPPSQYPPVATSTHVPGLPFGQLQFEKHVYGVQQLLVMVGDWEGWACEPFGRPNLVYLSHVKGQNPDLVEVNCQVSSCCFLFSGSC